MHIPNGQWTNTPQYGVCVLRDTGLDDAAHVAFSRRLGDLDDVRRFLTGGRKLRYALPELFDAGNLDTENNLLEMDSARAHANRVRLPFLFPFPFPFLCLFYSPMMLKYHVGRPGELIRRCS